jgi:SAM-dependent methyltransferase
MRASLFEAPLRLKIAVSRALHTVYHYVDAVAPRSQVISASRGYGRFLRDRRAFERLSDERLSRYDDNPKLLDWTQETPVDPHYAYQDAWAARQIFFRRPARHVDVGSRVSFVLGISAFVPVTFVDVRPPMLEVPNLDVCGGNVLALPFESESLESVSSLHVLEHIGLGRYGDALDPAGTAKALAELARVVAVNGSLYVSVPVGRPRIAFNAHRVLDPEWVVEHVPDLTLTGFAGVDDYGRFRQELKHGDLADCAWGCGFFHFTR